jgi:hypothetical protein
MSRVSCTAQVVGKPPNVETARALVQAKIAENMLRAARQWTPQMERVQMILFGEIVDPATASAEKAGGQSNGQQAAPSNYEEKVQPSACSGQCLCVAQSWLEVSESAWVEFSLALRMPLL